MNKSVSVDFPLAYATNAVKLKKLLTSVPDDAKISVLNHGSERNYSNTYSIRFSWTEEI